MTLGGLGNCWFLAAASSLATRPEIFKFVCPPDQESGFQAGIFKFRFWRYGEWVEVVIDDRLPTRGGRLIMNESDAMNEFWPALLEKAYAKIHGNYGALDWGQEMDAFIDFTGACIEFFSSYTDEPVPDKIFPILYKAGQLRGLMSCSFNTQEKGLYTGHAYSITKVILLRHDGKEIAQFLYCVHKCIKGTN